MLVAILVGSFAGCGGGGGGGGGGGAPRARNVVVILADDLGVADVSAYAPNRIPTPHIDGLAREGVRFTSAYASAAMCSPSRAGMLTGRTQNRFGFEYNAGPEERVAADHLGLDVGERTIADLARAAGLRTALIGKWHQGSQPEFDPTARGFDEFFGFIAGATTYIDPDVAGAVNGETVVPRRRAGPAAQIVRAPGRQVASDAREYLTEELTREALEFLDRNRDRPFLLMLAYNAPHTPLQTTQRYYDRFPEIADHRSRVYAAMVSALDDGVGAVLDRLDTLGLAADTLVVFASDNGCAAYTGLCDCSLRGGKLTLLEGGIRIPYLMRWPGGLPAGTSYADPVSLIDVLPTALASLGLALPTDRAYDGVDLAPFVRGTTTGSPHQTLHWRSAPLVAVRQGSWKLWEARDGSFSQLFDLASDPGERVDLSAQEPEQVRRLRADFDAWEADLAAPAWGPRRIEIESCGESFRIGF